ncbi:BRO-N domain-containing protein [Pseudomonas huanghezhanensis]|uniref:BRO-N domain-containing protein n=1 Tax=Pseudomonas huanghezhanensis TaxID=3002903 RepID=UPI0022856D9F|nr:BRO family protein [Pseudomonas sp. BSw22131]
MQFEKRNFMGIELDVLVGHPEHDLLFVATQVARAAGLKNPKNLTQAFKSAAGTLQVREVQPKVPNFGTYGLHLILGKRYSDAWLFPESVVYQMLLRGHAPASEPFRKWVAEEVLPTIRKTGKYDAEQSTDPVALSVMDELKAIEGRLDAKFERLTALIEVPG